MFIFLVNKEFKISLSTTTFCLHDGDFLWVKEDSVGRKYIYRVGYHIRDFDNNTKYHEMMVPINLNYDIYIHSNFKRRPLKEAIIEGYMSDITTQYNRNKKLNEIL